MATEKERLARMETHIEYIKEAVDEIRSTNTAADDRITKLERKAAWYAGGIAVISGGLGFIGSNLKAFVQAITT